MFRIPYFLLFLLTVVMYSGCTSPKNSSFLMHNVNGYTLAENEIHTFSALAVSDGKVVAVGDSEALRQQFRDFRTIDGEGKTLLPGLIDAHGHILNLGIARLGVDLAGTRSIAEAQERIRAFAEKYPDLEWIQGRGWNQELWQEARFPTAADIDAVVSDRPVWLSRVDGHAGWTNTAGLELAGITSETPDPEAGRLLRDADGNPTGVLVNRARDYIAPHIPPPGMDEKRIALEIAMNEIASYGLTAVHDARIDVEGYQLYQEFLRNGAFKTRVYAMIGGTGSIFDALAVNGPYSTKDDLFHLRSVKISSDGALGSRGAALMEDYHDDPGNRGLLQFEKEELKQMIEKAVLQGFQVNVHAIGDRANRNLLDIHEELLNQHGDLGLRHRVEHAQIVSLDDIPRFKPLHLIASMQPTHATSDMNMAEDRVGPYRILGGYAWQRFKEHDVIIAGGSDFPVEAVNPFYGWYAAVTRQDQQGMPEGGWYADQRMSRIEAFRAFTIDAAYAAFMEETTGSLEPGKWADFIILDRDPFTIPEEELFQVKVLETWLGGQKVFYTSAE